MKIIYVMDPICGWCYGNIGNIKSLYNDFKDQVDFEILPGGMWSGNNIRLQSPQMTNYFLKHDASITERTGIEFGEKYLNFIKTRNDVILDSEIPSRAIVTISKVIPEKTVQFTVEVLKARYSSGKDLNLDETYSEILKKLEISEDLFFNSFKTTESINNTLDTFKKASQYANSYPTILALKDGKTYLLENGFVPYSELKENIITLLQN